MKESSSFVCLQKTTHEFEFELSYQAGYQTPDSGLDWRQKSSLIIHVCYALLPHPVYAGITPSPVFHFQPPCFDFQ